MNIYEPEEDSFLLQGFVKDLAKGRVLDMGTGSGIQALAALENKSVREVIAVDINEDALIALKKKKISKLIVHRSDLFASVKGRFDTIIFNPPYLPDDNSDPDAALDGGKNGNELIHRFLVDAKAHLEKKGFILLLFSSFSGENTLDIIKKEGYSAELLGKKSLAFFEVLYVYKLTHSEGKVVFSSGKRGVIYREGKLCIKEKKPGVAADTIANEARILQIVNKKGIGPKFRSFDGKSLKRDFVEGVSIEEFLEKSSKKDALKVIKDVLLQCRKLDLLKINKTELTNPYKDIIISRARKAVMIDFERCRKNLKPQNVTQFLQYVLKKKKELEKKKIGVSREKLILLGKKYKDSSDDSAFGAIVDYFS